MSQTKMNLIRTPLGRLRLVAWIEGVTYLLLFITMPLKYILNIPEPNYIIGMAHGVFFIIYIGLVIQVSYKDKWNWRITFYALIASLLPFGTFYAENKWFRY